MIRMAYTSAPTLQGNVLSLTPKSEKGLRFRKDVHEPAYYGVPLNGTEQDVRARAGDLSGTAGDGSNDESQTIIGTDTTGSTAAAPTASTPGNGAPRSHHQMRRRRRHRR
jgi:hypothetical protein